MLISLDNMFIITVRDWFLLFSYRIRLNIRCIFCLQDAIFHLWQGFLLNRIIIILSFYSFIQYYLSLNSCFLLYSYDRNLKHPLFYLEFHSFIKVIKAIL